MFFQKPNDKCICFVCGIVFSRCWKCLWHANTSDSFHNLNNCVTPKKEKCFLWFLFLLFSLLLLLLLFCFKCLLVTFSMHSIRFFVVVFFSSIFLSSIMWHHVLWERQLCCRLLSLNGKIKRSIPSNYKIYGVFVFVKSVF